MRTYFGIGTLLPIDVQPTTLSIEIASKRSSGVTIGVEKIVVRIVVYSVCTRYYSLDQRLISIA